jgi:hypothetical protein
MENSALTPVIILALGIIAGLTAWAGTLLYQLYRSSRAQGISEVASDSPAKQQARMSVVVLAKSALSQQVDTTEAAIRIATLLDYLDNGNRPRQHYAPIFHLSEATAHIPRLEQWRKLSRAEQKQYREQMQQLEKQQPQQLRDSLQRLVDDFS